MGSLWIYRYRPMRNFRISSTTFVIGVPLRWDTLVRRKRGVNRPSGENFAKDYFFATLFQEASFGCSA
ncbi:MAG: hypothetical protein ACJAZ1_001325 [Yoonia sp.]|jgi:hypothetical protein